MKRVLSVAAIAAWMLSSNISIAGIVFQLSSPSAGLVTIGYAATANTGVHGLALNVQLSNNATAVYSDIVSIYPAFNTFIDYAFGQPGYNIGDGHPFANPGAAGAINSPSSFFTESNKGSGAFIGRLCYKPTRSGDASATLNNAIQASLTWLKPPCLRQNRNPTVLLRYIA